MKEDSSGLKRVVLEGDDCGELKAFGKSALGDVTLHYSGKFK